MKVLYDSNIFCVQKFGGISRYYLEMLHYANFNFRISFINTFIKNQDFIDTFNLPESYINKVNKLHGALYKAGIIELLNSIRFHSNVKTYKPDIYHATNVMFDDINLLKKVVTIHDMILENYAHLYASKSEQSILKYNITEKNKQIYKSDKIIAISKATKNDILLYHPSISPDKIDVIYHGQPTTTFIEKVVVPNKYILFVGQRTYYKNFIVLLKAFAQYQLIDKDLFLVCVGDKKFSEIETLIIKKHNLKDRVLHLESISNYKLNYIYQNALAFVFPSLSEGFGIPILEAFANNCPVILSDIICFKEIAQDAALYFKPDSIDDLSAQLEIIQNNKALKKELKSKGTTRLKDFSWEISAHQHQKTYNSLL